MSSTPVSTGIFRSLCKVLQRGRTPDVVSGFRLSLGCGRKVSSFCGIYDLMGGLSYERRRILTEGKGFDSGSRGGGVHRGTGPPEDLVDLPRLLKVNPYWTRRMVEKEKTL